MCDAVWPAACIVLCVRAAYCLMCLLVLCDLLCDVVWFACSCLCAWAWGVNVFVFCSWILVCCFMVCFERGVCACVMFLRVLRVVCCVLLYGFVVFLGVLLICLCDVSMVYYALSYGLCLCCCVFVRVGLNVLMRLFVTYYAMLYDVFCGVFVFACVLGFCCL